MNPLEEDSNVVSLPNYASEKRSFDAQSSIKFAKEVKAEFCLEAADFAFEQLFTNLKSFGFFQDTHGGRVEPKDILLIEQAIQAVLFRYYGLEHAMHGVTEEIFDVTEDEEEIQQELELETE